MKASCSLAMEYRVNAPQIAVIIATKNRPNLLKQRAINSVLNQTPILTASPKKSKFHTPALYTI